MKRGHCFLGVFLIVFMLAFLPLKGQPPLSSWTMTSLEVSNGTHVETQPAAAYDYFKDQFLVVWTDYRNENYDIYGRFIDADGTPIGEAFAICTLPSIQSHPDIDFNRVDKQYLVVWQDDRNVTFDIYAVILDDEGNQVDPVSPTPDGDFSFAVCNEENMDQSHAKVAHNYIDNSYLVVWYDMRETYPGVITADVYGQRIDADGSLMSPYDPPDSKVNFPIVKWDWEEYAPDVAYHGGTGEFEVNEWMVVWVQDSYHPELPFSRIWGIRINGENGMPLDTWGREVELPTLSKSQPQEVEGVFTYGFVIGYEGKGFVGMPEEPFYQGSPHIKGNDNWPEQMVMTKSLAGGYDYPVPEMMVSWTDFRNASVDNPLGQGDIYCQRVAYFPDSTSRRLLIKDPEEPDTTHGAIALLDENGELPDTVSLWIKWPNIPVCDRHDHQSWNDLAYGQNEGEFLFGWTDWRDGGKDGDPADVYGQRIYINPEDSALVWIGEDGNVQSDKTTNIVIANTSADEGCTNYPALAHSATKNNFIVSFDYDGTGEGQNLDIDAVVLGTNGSSGIKNSGSRVRDYTVAQNFPNPFNPNTVIEFSLPRAEKATIKVFDLLGREITTLLDRPLASGAHQVTWNGRDQSGVLVGSGVYFYRVEAGEFLKTVKMILMR